MASVNHGTRTYVPGASQTGAYPAFGAPIAGGATRAPECATIQSDQRGHHEPSTAGVCAAHASGST